jgi:hypothetical protein
MTALSRCRLLAVLAIVVALPLPTSARETPGGPWAVYHNPRFGIRIAFPRGLFVADRGRGGESGQVFVSPDGRARLLVGALDNADNATLEDYRAFVMQESYPGAAFQRSRSGARWFELAGSMGETAFYQWVTFLCDGRIINSWALTYPATDRDRYERVIEGIAESYQPGPGPNGACPRR